MSVSQFHFLSETKQRPSDRSVFFHVDHRMTQGCPRAPRCANSAAFTEFFYYSTAVLYNNTRILRPWDYFFLRLLELFKAVEENRTAGSLQQLSLLQWLLVVSCRTLPSHCNQEWNTSSDRTLHIHTWQPLPQERAGISGVRERLRRTSGVKEKTRWSTPQGHGTLFILMYWPGFQIKKDNDLCVPQNRWLGETGLHRPGLAARWSGYTWGRTCWVLSIIKFQIKSLCRVL